MRWTMLIFAGWTFSNACKFVAEDDGLTARSAVLLFAFAVFMLCCALWREDKSK